MKFGLDVPTAGEFADAQKLAELAAQAEAAGWDGFFLWDIVFNWHDMQSPVVDPWIALAAVALRTRRMRIGAFMTPLARRRPWQVAKQAATLDHLSGGRLVFGAALGYQEIDFTPFGEVYDAKVRAEKLDEALEIVTALWSGMPFTYTGKHYQVSGVTMTPRPLQWPRIPVWVAGGWPARKPFQRAAHWDGMYLMTVNQETEELLTPEEIREIRDYVTAHRTRVGDFELAVNGIAPEDPGEAAALIESYEAAGATWWVEYDDSDNGSLEAYRERIRRGPPGGG